MPGKENLEQEFSKVWHLIKCDKTGKLCFLNSINNEKRYTKPIGLKLTEFEEKQWNKFQSGKI